MKKLILSLSTIALIIAGIFTFAGCEKEESAISENIVLLSKANGFQNNYFDFSNYEFYTSNEFGIIHNELLNYTTTHIDINLDFSTIEDLVEYTKNLTQQFVDNYSFLEEDKPILSEYVNEYANFVILPYFFESTFPNSIGIVQNLYDSRVIDQYEFETLTTIINNIDLNYNQTISNEQFNDCIQSIYSQYSHEYSTRQSDGKFLGIILDIANGSIEYWGNCDDPTSGYAMVAPQVAADIGGAIISGGMAAYETHKESGSVNWSTTGKKALIGAGLASFGAAGKTGQLVCKAAEKAGGTVINGISKFISKF